MSGPYHLLFLDLGGTLVRPLKATAPRTLAALHRARRIGRPIVVRTARNRHTAEPIAREVGGQR